MNAIAANANWIIRYAGAGVTFHRGFELVADDQADRFPGELDAWKEARDQGLNLNRVAVVPFAHSFDNHSPDKKGLSGNYHRRS